MLFFGSSNRDLSNDTQFLEKSIVKHWLTNHGQVG